MFPIYATMLLISRHDEASWLVIHCVAPMASESCAGWCSVTSSASASAHIAQIVIQRISKARHARIGEAVARLSSEACSAEQMLCLAP